MKRKIIKRVLSVMLSIVLVFSMTTISYKEAKAEPLTLALGGAGAAAAGITVGGVLTVALALVAVGYGAYLVVDNWDSITSSCGDFLSKSTGSVKEWWDTICGSAVKVDEPTIPLPEQLSQTGEVINFFDYYTPSGGGSDPNNNGDKFELDPNVAGALYSFLLSYYGYESLTPDELMSNDVLKSMNYLQLANSGQIQYEPARQAILTADPNNGNTSGLIRAGFVYALLTPNKSPDLYASSTALYKIFDIPDACDSIFIGVKDNGQCYIHAMGFTGNIMADSSSTPTSNNSRSISYFYPTSTSALTLNQEPFLSTFGQYLYGAEYQKGFGWLTNNSATNRYYAGYDYTVETMDLTNDAAHAIHNAPIANWYTSAVPNGSSSIVQGAYYYAWDNVYYNDAAGTLTSGDYNVNFVGSEYMKFYSYDYEDYANNKSMYLGNMKVITNTDGANGVGDKFRKILPGQNYTIPKSAYKVVVPDGGTIKININDPLLEELSEFDTNTDNDMDKVVAAVNKANDVAIGIGQNVINQPIIEVSPGSDPTPGNITVDLTETNVLIENLPQNISDAMNVPGALSDAFSPSGDFTSLNNLKGGFTDFFNFDILYQYHELIESFLTQRINNNSPPVFKMYPKQSGLVYFKDMPSEVTVIDFGFMETEIFTWGITIRYFVRSLLTFFVFAVWLNKTIKKLPGVVSGL